MDALDYVTGKLTNGLASYPDFYEYRYTLIEQSVNYS